MALQSFRAFADADKVVPQNIDFEFIDG